MSTTTTQITNLGTPLIKWDSLQEIHDSIQAARYEARDGKRYFVIREEEIPTSKIANAIYARRPNLLDDNPKYLKLYFETARKFKELLPQEADEKSLCRKVINCFSDCFWGCYGPIQLCWCTPGCRENIIIYDSKLDMEGVAAWKEHIAEFSLA